MAAWAGMRLCYAYTLSTGFNLLQLNYAHSITQTAEPLEWDSLRATKLVEFCIFCISVPVAYSVEYFDLLQDLTNSVDEKN